MNDILKINCPKCGKEFDAGTAFNTHVDNAKKEQEENIKIEAEKKYKTKLESKDKEIVKAKLDAEKKATIENPDAAFASCDVPQELPEEEIDRQLGLLRKPRKRAAVADGPRRETRGATKRTAAALDEAPPPPPRAARLSLRRPKRKLYSIAFTWPPRTASTRRLPLS